MRPGKGCQSCRNGHRKCHVRSGASACLRCIAAGRECQIGSPCRFKQVVHINVDADHRGTPSRIDFRYSDEQTWVSPRKIVGFILDDGMGAEDDISSHQPITPSSDAPHIPVSDGLLSEPCGSGPPNVTYATAAASNSHRSSADHHHPSRLPSSTAGPLRSQTAVVATAVAIANPASIVELSRRHGDTFESASSRSFTPHDISPAVTLRKPDLSRREAHLIQHFIHRIGPWTDACDLSCHFTHELPQRAMHKPMVMFAILAVASRHLGLYTDSPDTDEASFYHGQCLRLVISALSGPESSYDDNLLATFVCLRVYEEMHYSTDKLLHLGGISRLLRVVPTFARSGGLGEAACWLTLRQDVYISMILSQPPSIPLEEFENSSALTFGDDGACANIVILLLAKILGLAFDTSLHATAEDWRDLVARLKAWDNQRLALFQPIYYEDLNLAEGIPFPIIHVISPPQVAALQYYHACEVYLLLYRPAPRALSDYHAARERRTLERDIATHLATIVGLAESNPFVENANFTAHHLLRVGGHCITNPFQRERVVDSLVRIEEAMGWATAPTVSLLKTQWEHLDSSSDRPP